MSDWLKKVRIQDSGKPEPDAEVVNLTIKITGRRLRDHFVYKAKGTPERNLSQWVIARCLEEFGEPE